MEHLFIQGGTQRTLVLLHGTGGDEHSLVELGKFLDPQANLLALRGTVQEGGANRYFRRFAEGEFDLADLAKQTVKLTAELLNLSEKYQLPLTEMVLVGYSNGANIGGHLLLEKTTDINKGILFHSMSLGPSSNEPELSNQKVWLSYGEQDPIVPLASFNELVGKFKKGQGEVTDYRLPISHGLVQAELVAARQWLEEVN